MGKKKEKKTTAAIIIAIYIKLLRFQLDFILYLKQ